ncbi:MAG: methyltransferase [Candidatus Bathyarchaeia archaeon]
MEHYFTPRPTSKMEFKLISAYLRGRHFRFWASSGVFSKEHIDPGTKLLIESMILPNEGYVLDIGCGYGVVGIVVAALNPNLHVIMVDVNERAVKLAKRNIRLNGVMNAEVRRGSLYEPVRGMLFDCILSNPPISAGMDIVEAIITGAPKYMRNRATIQIVIRSKIGRERFKAIFEKCFGNFSILARRGGYRVLIAEKRGDV